MTPCQAQRHNAPQPTVLFRVEARRRAKPSLLVPIKTSFHDYQPYVVKVVAVSELIVVAKSVAEPVNP